MKKKILPIGYKADYSVFAWCLAGYAAIFGFWIFAKQKFSGQHYQTIAAFCSGIAVLFGACTGFGFYRFGKNHKCFK